MNKKGEVIVVGIIIILIALASFYYLETKLVEKNKINYVGDSSTKIAYNLNSTNTECNLNSIRINREDLVFFEDRSKVEINGFRVDNICT